MRIALIRIAMEIGILESDFKPGIGFLKDARNGSMIRVHSSFCRAKSVK